MVRVKVCGITNLEDALLAVELGASALGFVFAPSPRQVTPEQVREIISHLPPFVAKVGVFVDAPLEEVKRILSFCPLDLAQLHGEESPEYCQQLFPRFIKAFRVKDAEVLKLLPSYRASAYLLDSYSRELAGGTGKSFPWELARQASRWGRVILSGGLTPENVGRAIRLAQPFGVDVASGVESQPGKKDPAKLKAFLHAVKEVESMTGDCHNNKGIAYSDA